MELKLSEIKTDIFGRTPEIGDIITWSKDDKNRLYRGKVLYFTTKGYPMCEILIYSSARTNYPRGDFAIIKDL